MGLDKDQYKERGKSIITAEVDSTENAAVRRPTAADVVQRIRAIEERKRQEEEEEKEQQQKGRNWWGF